MATKIFVNLPIKELPRSRAFFSKLGFSFNSQFTDDRATCMIVSEDIFVMLLTESRFQDFTPKKICDAHKSTEVLVALSADSRGEVDEMTNRALAAGATETRESQDHGFMYGRSFNDLDGHIWEIFWMDPGAVDQE